MVYTFARVGAAIGMRVGDVYVQGRRTWVRLHEKGGKHHEMPCHHNLDEYLHAYIDRARLRRRQGVPFSLGGRQDRAAFRETDEPGRRLPNDRAARAAADVRTKIGCHSFRATGITEYLRNGGKLEVAQQMANHEVRGRRDSTTGGRIRCAWMRWNASSSSGSSRPPPK